jgi:hypothetical protein
MAISVANKNQLPFLGFVSGKFRAKCIITAANAPAAGATNFTFPMTHPVTTSQAVLPTGGSTYRNGILEPDFTSIISATTVTITPVVATDLLLITVGDVLTVEIFYSQK